MARREYDFSPAKKEFVKLYHGYICATCGCDDPEHMTADHFIAADVTDAGVCMCQHCNTMKAALYIPEQFRFIPRDPIKALTHSEYKMCVSENRLAFKKWLLTFRYFKEGYNYNLKAIKFFKAPY